MNRTRLAVALTIALTTFLLLSHSQAKAASLPVTGTGSGVNLSGVLNITKFVNQGGQILAVGTLTGTVTNTAGTVLGSVTNLPVQLPLLLDQSSGTCQVLDLTLGPLHLDLLGLVVDLNQVHLTITAQSGPGNLLGNLLCAVAHLLDNNGPLAGLTGLLNNLLRAL